MIMKYRYQVKKEGHGFGDWAAVFADAPDLRRPARTPRRLKAPPFPMTRKGDLP